MTSEDDRIIKDIIKIREEKARLEKIANFLRMENFEYAIECNRMENAIANIEAMAKKCPAKLVDASQNICSMFGTSQTVTNNSQSGHGNSVDKDLAVKSARTSEKVTRCNKAHVVKPHMVNGHILYIPTINLTRVSDLHNKSESKSRSSETGNNSTMERSAGESSAGIASEASDTYQGFGNNDTEVAHIEEVSEASTSKSPSHSTVLSGTFQEVKIFLSPMSQESLDEQTRPSTSRTNINFGRPTKRRISRSVGGSKRSSR